MQLIRKAYDWTLSLAARPMAQWWLALIAFVESSFFLIPADVLYVPMALARPKSAYRLALIATLASTAGGVAGYLIGAYAFETLAMPVLAFYNKLEAFETLKACGGQESVMVLLVTSGLSHLPPIKVVTILAGVLQVGLPFFIASCIIARGARFFAMAYALKRWGEPIRHFLETRLTLIAMLIVLLLALVIVALKLAGSGSLVC
jgi:membrane protein YqaA with SNARE-associated domain